jgi:hypothetical protein
VALLARPGHTNERARECNQRLKQQGELAEGSGKTGPKGKQRVVRDGGCWRWRSWVELGDGIGLGGGRASERASAEAERERARAVLAHQAERRERGYRE